MSKYIVTRYLLLKIFLYSLVTVLLVFGSVWFLARVDVNQERIEQASTLANSFYGNTIYVQAPGLRTDIDMDLLSSLSDTLYFDEEQISKLNEFEFVDQVIPLSGSVGDGENKKIPILPYFDYIDMNGEDVVVQILSVPSEISPDKYYTQNLIEGSFPEDNSNQIAISNYYKEAEIGEKVEYDSDQYTIVGIIDDNQSPQILLPYTSDGYKQSYYKQTVSDIEMRSNTKIGTDEVVYGDLLIMFKDAPTNQQLKTVEDQLPNGKIYYSNYTNFKFYQLLYIMLAWKKNVPILAFAVSTCFVLLSILNYLLGRENKKMTFFGVPPSVIYKANKLEIYIQYMFVLIGSVFLYILWYRQLLSLIAYLTVILLLLSVSNILLLGFKNVFKWMWGPDDATLKKQS